MPEQQDTAFGKTIFDARRDRGWSLRQAAKRIGISYPRLDEFETGIDGHTGKPVRPAYPTVLAMARAYELPEDELVVLAGYELPSPAQNDEERSLLAAYRSLKPEERVRLRAHLESLADAHDGHGGAAARGESNQGG